MRRSAPQGSKSVGDAASSSRERDGVDSKSKGLERAQFLGAFTVTLLFLYALTSDRSPPIEVASISAVRDSAPAGAYGGGKLRANSAGRKPAAHMETTSEYLQDHVRPRPKPREGTVVEIHGGNADHLGRIASCPSKGSPFGTKVKRRYFLYIASLLPTPPSLSYVENAPPPSFASLASHLSQFGHCVTTAEHYPLRRCESEPTCTHVVWNVEGTLATLYVSHDWTPAPSYLSANPEPPWWKLKDCQDTADSGVASKDNRAAWASVRGYGARTAQEAAEGRQ